MADEIRTDLTKFVVDEIATAQGAAYRIHYVNSSRMAVSPWDVRLTVGQVIEAAGRQVNQDEATLIMSPQHAKQFLQSLEKTIRQYEEMFGAIPEPAALIEKAKAAGASVHGPKPQLRRTKP